LEWSLVERIELASKLRMDSLWTEPKVFPPYNSSIWDLKSIFER
jgi:hypothetical protein